MQSELPILYSFRRCPYAMRARMAIVVSSRQVMLREVLLKAKPDELIEVSPKSTVPVLVMTDGTVLEESLDIMEWALAGTNGFYPKEESALQAAKALVEHNDHVFKPRLDQYKYPDRFPDLDPQEGRNRGVEFIEMLESALNKEGQWLGGGEPGWADLAILPFVRQFANVDRSWFDQASWVKVQEWLNRFLEHPIFVKVMDKYKVWEPGSSGIVFPPK